VRAARPSGPADEPPPGHPAAQSPPWDADESPRGAARAFDGDWPALAAVLPLSGFAQQFMQQSELLEAEGLSFRVRVPIRPLAEPGTVARVRDALAAHFGAPVRLGVEVGAVAGQTAAAAASQQRAERLQQAQAAMEADPFVQSLLTDFGGRILPGSVRPNEQ
jgi:DNA polymerase-3 subunit gamma/tau